MKKAVAAVLLAAPLLSQAAEFQFKGLSLGSSEAAACERAPIRSR